MDIPDHKVNPVCSRRWREGGVFKGQSGQDYIRYFEMIILSYKNQNNMVGIGARVRRRVGRCPSGRKLGEASVQGYGSSVVLKAWISSFSVSQLQLFICLFRV